MQDDQTGTTGETFELAASGSHSIELSYNPGVAIKFTTMPPGEGVLTLGYTITAPWLYYSISTHTEYPFGDARVLLSGPGGDVWYRAGVEYTVGSNYTGDLRLDIGA